MKHFIIPMLCLLALSASAQSRCEAVLSMIEKNNTSLAALRSRIAADKTSFRTDLSPAGPEAEFGYHWGNKETGNRKTVNVSQSLEMPSVYANKRKLADAQSLQSDLTYAASRNEILLEAKLVCVDITYYNSLLAFYAIYERNLQATADAYKSALDKGSATLPDYNKANLSLVNLQDEIALLRTERDDLLGKLKELNGGLPVSYDEKEFDTPALPSSFGQWYAQGNVEALDPHLQLLEKVILTEQRRVSLAKSLNLPSVSVGFAGEYVRGSNFQGVNVGVSVPLWQNRNKVKAARQGVAAAEMEAADRRTRVKAQLEQLYNRAVALTRNLDKFDISSSVAEHERYVKRAFDLGQLSLVEYLLENQYFFDAIKTRISNRRLLAQTEAQLNAFSL